MKKLILFIFILLSFSLYAQRQETTYYSKDASDNVKVRKAADFIEGEYGILPVRNVSQTSAIEGETADAMNAVVVAGDSADVYLYGTYQFMHITIQDSVKYGDTLYVELYDSDRELAGKICLIDQLDRSDNEYLTTVGGIRRYLVYEPYPYGVMVYNTGSDSINVKISGN